jgi:hypothetical protein
MDFTLMFFFLASLTMLQLVYQDLKERLVGENLSYYMMGVVSVIMLSLGFILQWIVLLAIITFGLTLLKPKLAKWIGEGDITILCWLLPGIGALSFPLLILFVFFYCIGLIAYFLFFKQRELEGTIPMFLALILIWIIYAVIGVI